MGKGKEDNQELTANTAYGEPAPNLQNDFVYNSEHKKECNDVFFLLIFLAFFIMTIVFAGKYGGQFMDATKIQDLDVTSGYHKVFNVVLQCALASIGMSLAWIVIMIVAGEFLIRMALILIIVGNIVAGIFITKKLYDADIKYYWWPAVAFGVCALLIALYVCCIKNRIKFAAKHLKVAGCAILALPMTLGVALVMVFVQLAWIYTWILGEYGILYHGDYITIPTNCTINNCTITSERPGAIFGITIGMIIVFFWGAIVAKNIVHVTVAGTVGAWKIRANSPLITMKAWLRALTFSLGSICFGSLIVAILETIKQIFNAIQSAANRSGNCVLGCVACCAACIIGCIERLVEYFNRYAFTYVGIYGYSFITAGGHVFKLFAAKGWTAIVNDDLTGNVFWLGDILIGTLSALIAVSLVHHDPSAFSNIEQPEVVVGFLAFLAGYAISHIFMAVMASGVTTVFVLWAEDPHGWQLTHPDHYASLHEAWLKMYPEEYNNGYGKQQAPGAQIAQI